MLDPSSSPFSHGRKENFYQKLSRKRVPYYRLSRVNSKCWTGFRAAPEPLVDHGDRKSGQELRLLKMPAGAAGSCRTRRMLPHRSDSTTKLDAVEHQARCPCG